jgi:hypothetical protein
MASERDRRRLIRPLGIVAVPVTSAECGQAGGCFRFPANRPPLVNVLIVHWKKVGGVRKAIRPAGLGKFQRFSISSTPWDVLLMLGRFADE